jgi:hypothetical protein
MLNKELVKELKGLQKQYEKKQERSRAFSLKLELGGKLKVINTVLESDSIESANTKLDALTSEAEAETEINKPVKQMGDVDIKCRYFGMRDEINSVKNLLK